VSPLTQFLLSRPWTDWPVPTARSRYTEAIAEYAAAAMELDSVTAVHQIGSVAEPGISDIDLIVVLRDGASEHHRRFRNLWRRGNHAGLWAHDPLVVDESLLTEMPYLLPVFNSVPIAGTEAGTAEADPMGAAPPEIQLLHLVQMCVVKVPRELVAELALHRHVRVRQLLLLISSFRHTARLAVGASGIGGSSLDQRWQRFADDVASLRQEWFELPEAVQRVRLATLFEQALQVANQIGASAGELVEASSPEIALPKAGTRTSGFFPCRVRNHQDASTDFRELLRGWPVVRVEPGVIAFIQTVGSRTNGAYESYLRRHFGQNGEGGFDPALARVVDRHVAAVNAYIRFSRHALRQRPSPYLALGAGEPALRRVARLAYNRARRLLA
jgi:hypothetical protein